MSTNLNPLQSEYTLPGVMRYLQSEWQRNERDRIQWELERSEMKSKIAKLEGEKRGLQIIVKNYMKRIQILESSIQTQRTKSSPTASSEESSDYMLSISNDTLNTELEELEKISEIDLNPLIESRQYLETCIQEVMYLLQPPGRDSEALIPPRIADSLVHGVYPQNESNLAQAMNFTNDRISRKMENHLRNDQHSPDEDEDEDEDYDNENDDRDEEFETTAPTSTSSSLKNSNDEENHSKEMERERENLINNNNDGDFNNNKLKLEQDHKQSKIKTKKNKNKKSKNLKIKSKKNINNNNNNNENVFPISPIDDPVNQIADVLLDERLQEANFNEEEEEELNRLDELSESKKMQSIISGIDELGFDQHRFKKLESSPNLINDLKWNTIATLRGHIDTIRAVEFISSEEIATSSDDGTIKIWNLSNPKNHQNNNNDNNDNETILKSNLTLRGHNGIVSSLIYARNLNLLISSGGDPSIKIWKLNSSEPFGELTGHNDMICDIDYFDLDNLLCSSSVDGTVQIWDIRSCEQKIKFDTNILNTENNSRVPTGSKFLGNSSRIAVSFTDGVISMLDTETGKVIQNFADPPELISTINGQGLLVNDMKFSTIDNLLVVAYSDGHLRYFDKITGSIVNEVYTGPSPLQSVAVSPLGSEVVTGNRDGIVSIWSTRGGLSNCTLNDHDKSSTDGVCSVAWHSKIEDFDNNPGIDNYSLIASGGGDPTAKVYLRA